MISQYCPLFPTLEIIFSASSTFLWFYFKPPTEYSTISARKQIDMGINYQLGHEKTSTVKQLLLIRRRYIYSVR